MVSLETLTLLFHIVAGLMIAEWVAARYLQFRERRFW
jgi:hypothetical protein